MKVEKSLIYTKGGDTGMTSLLGGKRVSKHHVRIEAYGTIDELMAHTALLRDMSANEESSDQLLVILERLMSMASLVAAEGNDLPVNMPSLSENDVEYLENCIDRMDHELPKLNTFILPGGDASSSQAHVARTICRRTERTILRLADSEPVDELIIKYINRLSDYYFLLSRYLAFKSGAGEIHWKP